MNDPLQDYPSFFGFTFRSVVLAILAWTIAAGIAWVGFELKHCLNQSKNQSEITK